MNLKNTQRIFRVYRWKKEGGRKKRKTTESETTKAEEITEVGETTEGEEITEVGEATEAQILEGKKKTDLLSKYRSRLSENADDHSDELPQETERTGLLMMKIISSHTSVIAVKKGQDQGSIIMQHDKKKQKTYNFHNPIRLVVRMVWGIAIN